MSYLDDLEGKIFFQLRFWYQYTTLNNTNDRKWIKKAPRSKRFNEEKEKVKLNLFFFLYFFWRFFLFLSFPLFCSGHTLLFSSSSSPFLVALRWWMIANSITAPTTKPNETIKYCPRTFISDAEGLSDYNDEKDTKMKWSI